MELLAPDLEFAFEIYNDRVMMYQLVDEILPPQKGGPAISAQVPYPCQQLGHDFGFWELAATNHATHKLQRARRREELRREATAHEDDYEVGEKLEWALNKDEGHGIHIGYGTHKPA